MATMKLFHVSEQSGIAAFHPRRPSDAWPDLVGEYVWAISEELLPNYLLLRDCPRICLRGSESSDTRHVEQLMGGDTRPLILLNECWKEAVEQTALFVYEFNPLSFRLLDAAAGYWISAEIQHPISEKQVTNVLDRLKGFQVRVEFRDELAPLYQAVAESSLRYSMIKM